MQYSVIIAYVVGILMLYGVIWILYKPLRAVFKIILNSALGSVGLVVFNLLFGWLGMGIGVNAWTALTVGILGLPGMALLIFLQRLFCA